VFIEIPNENRIKSGLRYSHYILTWKLKVFFERIKFDGFSVGFPTGFSINFRLTSKFECHKQNCGRSILLCNKVKEK